MKVVIIGGVAGGATAAARLRRLDEQAEIIVFEQSGYVSYANCGLPYYIGGTIENAEELTLQTPESFDARFRVDMRVHHEVTAIHPERKTVSVKNLETGEEFDEGYDKIILSPGAKPTQPKLPGVGIKSSLHCGPWRIPSALRTTSMPTIPSPPYWREGALSGWSWRRICGSWEWRSPSSSGPSS